MACNASDFFRHFFQELGQRGIPYVILHSYEELPENVASDIDYAVCDADLWKIRPVLAELAQKHGWMLAQVLQHQVFAFYCVIIDPNDPRNHLKLDVCSHYVKDRCFLLSDTELLDGRRHHGDFWIPSPSSEFIYVLAKVFGKNKRITDFISRLRELWEEDRDGAQKRFSELFGETGITLEQWFQQPPEAWESLNKVMRARNGYGSALHLREMVRVVKRARQPTGFYVALMGPDGVGKSTLLERLSVLVEPCFRQQQVYHFRPMMFEKRRSGVVTEPHAQPARSRLFTWAKLGYYFIDHLVGYFAVILPAKIRSTLVAFDRTFCDMLVDQTRYRLAPSQGTIRVLDSFLPKPDITFILDADARVIHERKPELPLDELDRQNAKLREFANSRARHILVPAGELPDIVAGQVAREIIRSLATRLDRRG